MIKGYFNFAKENLKITDEMITWLSEMHITIWSILGAMVIMLMTPLTITPIVFIHRIGVEIQEFAFVTAWNSYPENRK